MREKKREAEDEDTEGGEDEYHIQASDEGDMVTWFEEEDEDTRELDRTAHTNYVKRRSG